MPATANRRIGLSQTIACFMVIAPFTITSIGACFGSVGFLALGTTSLPAIAGLGMLLGRPSITKDVLMCMRIRAPGATPD